MLQPGGEFDLSQEAFGPERGRELGVEDLERDRAVVLQVLGEEDRGHPPAPELALEGVASPQPCLQLRAEIGHVGDGQGNVESCFNIRVRRRSGKGVRSRLCHPTKKEMSRR